MKNAQAYIGKKVGRLTILETYREKRAGKTVMFAKCVCECGTHCDKRVYSIMDGATSSCGCLVKEGRKKAISEHQLYKVWVSMKQRCYNSNNASYHRYGGRGIKLCDEWVHDPEAFILWSTNNGWKPGLTIERVNNDGIYEPANCAFIPKSEQTKNYSRNVFLDYNGERKHLREWARVFNTDTTSIRYRYDHGLPLEGVRKDREKAISMRIPLSKVDAVKKLIYS